MIVTAEMDQSVTHSKNKYIFFLIAREREREGRKIRYISRYWHSLYACNSIINDDTASLHI